jgi:hypothetical protein
MPTISEINHAIMFNGLTNDQLDSVIMAVKFARSNIAKANIRYNFKVGSDVKFRNSKRNEISYGKITKIARKFITVQVGSTMWRVPANMIEADA